MSNWCLIESDPGVFTELIEKVGVESVEVQELYSMDVDTVKQMNDQTPIHGLVFLLNVNAPNTSPKQPIQHEVPGLFFSRQVINNACATIALINILMNADVDLGPVLGNYKEFAQLMTPEDRGEVITNSDDIREVHNSFSRQETFSMESRAAEKDEKVFHFVAFVPFQGRVYELDGIKAAPIDHGPIEDSWLETACAAIQQRMQSYPAGEVHFNLMAVTQSRLSVLEEELEGYEAQLLSLEGSDDDAQRSTLEAEMSQVKQSIEQEKHKHQQYKLENDRRKHNYIPLFLHLMRELAKNGKLRQLTEQSKETMRRRMAERAAKKASA